MKIVILLIMLTVILGANFYVFYRLVRMLPPVGILRWLLIALGVLLVASFLVIFVLRDAIPEGMISILYTVGTSWFFMSIYFVLVFLILDIIRVTHLLPVEKFMYNSWSGFGIIVGLVIAVMTLGYIKYQNKARVELNLSIAKPGGNVSSAPLKIVMISDLHLGYTIGAKEFSRWVDLVNKENPDIVLIAGDAIDNNIRPVREQNMGELFKNIRSKYGIYMAVGNHEYISGLSESLHFLRDAGVNVLRDSSVLINNQFYVVGRDDRSNPGRLELKELVAGLDHSKPIIVLDHQPYTLEKTENARVDLQLSGHTHHGQLWPISWITQAIYEKAHGYLLKGNSHIYVSSGIGIWGGKFRIGTQSEYVVINLSTTP